MMKKIMLSIGILFSLFLISSAFAWWNSDYDNKRLVSVTNQQANYSIPLNLTYNTHYKNADCSDIRFTNSSENEEIDYWVEKNVSSDYCYVWVETRQADNFYLYYGNNTPVDSGSNITNTFIYGIDWTKQTSIPSDWLNTSSVSYSFSATDGIILTFSGADSWTTNGMYLNAINFTPSIAVRTVDYTQNSGLGFSQGFANNPSSSNIMGGTGNGNMLQDKSISDLVGIAKYINGVYSAETTGGTSSTNTLYTVEGIYLSNNNERFWTQGLGHQVNRTDTISSPVKISYGVYFVSTTLKIRQTIVRNYAEPEPTTSLGSEEGSPQSPTWRDIIENQPDPSVYNPSTNYGFQVNFTDNIEVDTVLFEHDLSGSWANITCSNITDIFYTNMTGMSAGVLNYSFIGNDSSNNQNRTDYNTFTVSALLGDCNLTSSYGWSFGYGNSTTLTCVCNGVGNLYFNHVLHNNYNDTNTIFGGGVHNVTCNMTGTSNYTFAQDSNNLTISKISPTLNISLNGTYGNRHYNNSDIVEYNAYRNPNGFIFLGGNLTDFSNNGSTGWFTPYSNTTQINCSLNNTLYSVTINSTESENYTYGEFTRYAICLRGMPSGHYEKWYCDPDYPSYLVKEIQLEDDSIIKNSTFCEFGCSSWLSRARCDPEPFVKWVIFIAILLLLAWVVKFIIMRNIFD